MKRSRRVGSHPLLTENYRRWHWRAAALAGGVALLLGVAMIPGSATQTGPARLPLVPGPAPGAPPDAAEMAAHQFLARVSRGDVAGSQWLLAGGADLAAAPDWLVRLTALQPRLLRLGRLPGAPGLNTAPVDAATGVDILTWVDYHPRAAGAAATVGALLLHLVWREGPPGAWRVAEVTGPLLPEGGFRRLPMALYETTRYPWVPAATPAPAVLWSPRQPEADLVPAMTRLAARLGDGVAVVLVLDIATPAEFQPFAATNGWDGPVLRSRERLEAAPVLQVQPYLGALGLLVDPQGLVVGPLGALDPARYGLAATEADAVADLTLRAFGLLP